MSEVLLKGKIIGFEEYEDYTMVDAFGESSPFRLLSCASASVSFAVVNPYSIIDDYAFELEDNVIKDLNLGGDTLENIAVLCIVRPDDNTLFINLRSPLIINTKDGLFEQVILQNEAYGTSVPFAIKKD